MHGTQETQRHGNGFVGFEVVVMVEVTLLGSAQDGGVPQVGCDCCIDLNKDIQFQLG